MMLFGEIRDSTTLQLRLGVLSHMLHGFLWIPGLHGLIPSRTLGEEAGHNAYLRKSGQEKNCHWDGAPPAATGDTVLSGRQRGASPDESGGRRDSPLSWWG